jgi:hypothetical protein
MKEDLTILGALIAAGSGFFLMYGLGPALAFCGCYVLSISLFSILKK